MIYITLKMFLVAIIIVTVPTYCGVQIVPEKASVVSMNEKYAEKLRFYIRRYSRKDKYRLNIETILKEEWNNNVTFNLIFYEFLHNEYRRSFVEVHYKFCDFLKYEKFIAPAIIECGIKCPFRPGSYRFMNLSFPLDKFPNVFPFEKARLDIEFAVTETGENIARMLLDASFKNRITSKKN